MERRSVRRALVTPGGVVACAMILLALAAVPAACGTAEGAGPSSGSSAVAETQATAATPPSSTTAPPSTTPVASTTEPPTTQAASTTAAPTPTSNGAPSSTEAGTIEYRNETYGFTFRLPASWRGYSIVTQQWEGTVVDPTGQTSPTDPPLHGPELLIRHPEWTATHPLQDIPIMVFTLSEWRQIENEALSVSAAPIPPSELGRNSTYVFALPARYNYAFPTGWEDVDTIVQGHPLQGFDLDSSSPSALTGRLARL